MSEEKITEKESHYSNLEKMSASEILRSMNQEDKKVADIVKSSISEIEILSEMIFEKLNSGGRLFYIGAGTSGRLGVLDAAECPPTFGVNTNRVIGIIAGGKKALHSAVEFAEDDENQGWKDLKKKKISAQDFVVGISASGTTPYVLAALQKARKMGITVGAITCNKKGPISTLANLCICLETGPEFVSGSTRLKAGTATKLVLNMLSTSVMIRLGHVKGNQMIDLKLNSKKLWDRACKIIVKETGCTYKMAEKSLKKTRNIRKSIKEVMN